jgi:hypothetical protein
MPRLLVKKGKRPLIYGIVCGAALLLGLFLWRKNIDADPALTIPTPQVPSPNAFDLYNKAGQAHQSIERATPGASAVDPVTDRQASTGLSPSQLQQRYPTAVKEAWIRKNSVPLRLLRQGFSYPYREPPNRSSTATFSHYALFRNLARLLIIESHAKSERGDWAGASQSALDVLRLGHDVPRGGALIAALVGYAINAIGRKELYNVVPHLDAATSRTAARQIEKLEADRFTYAEVMQEEKWFGLASLQDSMRKPNWRSSLFSDDELELLESLDWKTRLQMQMVSKRQVMDNYIRYMDSMIAQGKLPYASGSTPIPIPNDPVNQMVLPVFERARWNDARDELGNILLEVMLALRAFQLQHGSYPLTLNALVPSYLTSVPRDPFGGGEALRYRITGDTYMLYSIGPDGKDDGGKAINDPTAPVVTIGSDRRFFVLPDSKGDMVAGINR